MLGTSDRVKILDPDLAESIMKPTRVTTDFDQTVSV